MVGGQWSSWPPIGRAGSHIVHLGLPKSEHLKPSKTGHRSALSGRRHRRRIRSRLESSSESPSDIPSESDYVSTDENLPQTGRCRSPRACRSVNLSHRCDHPLPVLTKSENSAGQVAATRDLAPL